MLLVLLDLTEAISTVGVLKKDHKFHSSIAAEHKYDKIRIENWPQAKIEFGVSRLVTLRNNVTDKSYNILHTHPHSLQTTLETFHFFGTVLMFPNPTLNTKSNIHLRQIPIIIGTNWRKHSRYTKYTTSLLKRQMGSSQTPGVTEENL